MANPIVLLTAEELASHTDDNTYQWDRGAKVGKWLVLIAPDRKQYHDRYGCMLYDGEDRGGLWLAGGELVDQDGMTYCPMAVIRCLEAMGYQVGADYKEIAREIEG